MNVCAGSTHTFSAPDPVTFQVLREGFIYLCSNNSVENEGWLTHGFDLSFFVKICATLCFTFPGTLPILCDF